MRGTFWGICGVMVLLAGCGPAEKNEPPQQQAEVRRDYAATAVVAGDYGGPAGLTMQDWKFSHLRLQSPDDQHPVAFVFVHTKPITNAHGERQKLIVAATEYSVTDEAISVSAVSSLGGPLSFNGRFKDGRLVGSLSIASNPPFQGVLTKRP